jgi:TetR/AcrR family transcriptional regulator, transcriptional repressor for nem operon
LARPRNFDSLVVLDRAVKVFWRGGFEATAVETLCDEMKLSPGSLYGAFGGKRELFLSALDRYMDQISSDAIRRIAAPASGMEGIRSYFCNLVDAIVEGRRMRGCLLTNSLIELGDRDPEVARKVSLNLTRLETAFAGALTRAVAAGEIGTEPGAVAAPFLVCVVQGLNVMANAKPTREMLERIVTTALLSLQDGRARPPTRESESSL